MYPSQLEGRADEASKYSVRRASSLGKRGLAYWWLRASGSRRSCPARLRADRTALDHAAGHPPINPTAAGTGPHRGLCSTPQPSRSAYLRRRPHPPSFLRVHPRSLARRPPRTQQGPCVGARAQHRRLHSIHCQSRGSPNPSFGAPRRTAAPRSLTKRATLQPAAVLGLRH